MSQCDLAHGVGDEIVLVRYATLVGNFLDTVQKCQICFPCKALDDIFLCQNDTWNLALQDRGILLDSCRLNARCNGSVVCYDGSNAKFHSSEMSFLGSRDAPRREMNHR